MKRAGYELIDDRYVLHDDVLNHNKDDDNYVEYYTDEDEQAILNCWGSFQHEGSIYDDLKHDVFDLNIALTALFCQSDYYKSECFDIVMKQVDSLINRYNMLLTKGDGFQFVCINTKVLLMNNDLLEDIELDIQEIKRWIEVMFDYLQGKD